MLTLGLPVKGYEWLYPVVQIDAEHLYVIYQTSLHHIELWKWNIYTQYATKSLLSTYMPAGLKRLPSGEGFSFVDNDKICVKYDIKRSPKVIPLDAPLYNFTLLHWIDASYAYLSAQEHDKHNIYQIDMEGRTWCIVSQNSCDCVYPQKIDQTLFYLERYVDKTIFTSCEYPNMEKYGPEYEYDGKPYIDWNTRQELLTVDDSLIFLNMIDTSHGYAIQHASHIDYYQKSIEFTYNSLYKDIEGVWHIQPCFSYILPTSLLFGSDRLYESLLPFLPQVYNDSIYFVSLESDTYENMIIPNLTLYKYMYKNPNIITIDVVQKQHAQYLCSPCKINSSLYYGGSLKDYDTISMSIENGYVIIRLPHTEL